MAYSSRLVRVAAFVVFLCSAFTPANAEPSGYIVLYKTHAHKDAAVKSKKHKVKHAFNIIPAVTADLDANQAAELAKDPDVEAVEPDYKIYASSYPDSAALSIAAESITESASETIPYGIAMVNAPAVWPMTKGAGVRVAVLDTGISMFHPDAGRILASTSFVTDQAVEDLDSHGTHTSGTIAARQNGIGVVGVAPEADLLIGKVLDNEGSGQTSWLIEGIEWAVNNRAKVISMSLGSPDYSSALEAACNSAFAWGTLLVAAAGNDNTSVPDYPAYLASVVSVAAIDQNRARASFSNYGPDIEFAAPGVSVYSTVPVASDASASAVWSGVGRQANVVTGTSAGTLAESVCNCGLANGQDPANTCPDIVAGKIAHIRRGITTFAEKVAHARSKGAIGVIISNNVAGNFSGTLNQGSPLVVVSVSQADGDQLQALASSDITASISVDSTLYGYNSGTSMACPHVSGVAALLFAASGVSTSPSEIRAILYNSSQDLGSPGRDQYFGYGLVNAAAAMTLVTPHDCSAIWNSGRGLTGDIDHDCAVGLKDMFTLAGQWLGSCSPANNWCSGADFNHSGSVEFADFSSLALDWLNCNNPQNPNCL